MLLVVEHDQSAALVRSWNVAGWQVLHCDGLLFEIANHEYKRNKNGLVELQSNAAQQTKLDILADWSKYTDKVVFAFSPTTSAELNALYICQQAKINISKCKRAAIHSFDKESFLTAIENSSDISVQLAEWEWMRRTIERYFVWNVSRELQNQYQQQIIITRQACSAIHLLTARAKQQATHQESRHYELHYEFADGVKGQAKTDMFRGGTITSIKRAESFATELKKFIFVGEEAKELGYDAPKPLTYTTLLSHWPDATYSELTELYASGQITYPFTTTEAYSLPLAERLNDYIGSKGKKGTAPEQNKTRSSAISITSPAEKKEGLCEQIRLHSIASALPAAKYVVTKGAFESALPIPKSNKKLTITFDVSRQVRDSGWRSVYPNQIGENRSVPHEFYTGKKYSPAHISIREVRSTAVPDYQLYELMNEMLSENLAGVHDLPYLIPYLVKHKLAIVTGNQIRATDLGLELSRGLAQRGFNLERLEEIQQLLRTEKNQIRASRKIRVLIGRCIKTIAHHPIIAPAPCPKCHKPLRRQLSEDGSFEPFWSCTDRRHCNTALYDVDGKPSQTPGHPKHPCPLCSAPLQRKRKLVQGSDTKHEPYWSCPRWREGCKVFLADIDGEPETGYRCPKCKSHQLKRRSGNYGSYWSCSGYPDCNGRFGDKAGLPVLDPPTKRG
jgi:ssDNA-binding Zn-finger/Zn-ribbon topoisomerase 1